MDGIAAVQARIATIQQRFAPQVAPTVASSSAASSSSASFDTALTTALSQVQSTQGGKTALGALSALGGLSAVGAGAAGGPSGNAVVEAARKYIGVPYLWGGTDPAKGLDCSGLVQRVYADLGIDLPRTSGEQARAGRPVASLAEAQPGDIVAFDNTSSRPGVDHIGIYIGDGKMIVAPSSGKLVQIQTVKDPVAIRRILPDAPTTAVGGVGATATPAGALAGVPYADLFVQAGAKHGVPAALLAAVAKTESGFNPNAVSPAGARGLMQFMPGTARERGVNPMDPASAVNGAASLLADHLRRFGSVDLALAAYNAGPGAVTKHGGVPPFKETQGYVAKVNAAWEEYR